MVVTVIKSLKYEKISICIILFFLESSCFVPPIRNHYQKLEYNNIRNESLKIDFTLTSMHNGGFKNTISLVSNIYVYNLTNNFVAIDFSLIEVISRKFNYKLDNAKQVIKIKSTQNKFNRDSIINLFERKDGKLNKLKNDILLPPNNRIEIFAVFREESIKIKNDKFNEMNKNDTLCFRMRINNFLNEYYLVPR